MITEESVIAEIAEANPVPNDAGSHTAQERAEAERVLRRVLDEAETAPTRRRLPPRRWLPLPSLLVPVASVLVVVIVAAVALRTGGSLTGGQGGSADNGGNGGLRIALSAQPTPQTPRVTASAMSREIALIRHRLRMLGVSRGFGISQSGASGIVVTGPRVSGASRELVVRLITQSNQLRFYDWEANVLTRNGRSVASQLPTRNPTALSISQGGKGGTGYPGAGSMSLYDAVKLAAKQPVRRLAGNLSRIGPEYYVFGTGRAACAPIAGEAGTNRAPEAHCLLAGPVDSGSAGPHDAVEQAAALYPSGRIPGHAEVIPVPQGTVILQAEQSSAAAAVPLSSPLAQFFVLRDDLALPVNNITNPKASTDTSGEPDVTFGFTPLGRAAFQRTTLDLARRGATVSLGANVINQHFAIALDSQILTVPQIDYHTYPEGITAPSGADITGGLTAQSATGLASELRDGALPLALRVVP